MLTQKIQVPHLSDVYLYFGPLFGVDNVTIYGIGVWNSENRLEMQLV